VAALANPYGYRQFFNGSSLLGSAYVKQEVIELMPLVPQQKLWLGLVVAIIALSLVLNRRKLSLADLLLVLPFIYLSCTARRFVFLAAFVGIPVAIRNFTSYLDHRGWQERCRSRWLAGGVGCWLVLYTVLTLAHILPLETTNFGTGFSYDQTPRGGVDYLDRNRIFGKVFNTPVFGQYILWTSYPHRTVIADARFHGDGRLLQRLDDALFSDDVLDGLYRDYGFEVLLVKSAEISRGGLLKDSSLQFNHPRWALVYWDDTSMVYLRRTEAFAAIIARDEYRVVKPYLTISGFNRQLGTTVDTGGLVRELSDNIRRTGSGLAYLYLGLLHSKGGRYDQALACFTRTRDYGGIRDYMLAETYRNMGDYDNSLRHYRQSLQSAGSSYAYLGLGSEYFRRGDHRKAEDALKKAVAMDGSGERGYVLLEQLYRQRGDEVHAREIAATLARVRMVNRGKQLFGIGIRHYLAKEYDQAVTAFTSSLEYDSGNATTMVNLGFCYLDLGDYGKARDNFEKAVAVDAKQANAYYGLALIDKAQGRREQAAGNFARYIRLMPQGKYSRKAGEELRSLQGK
jgi:tetratricopeptide (TPR) repeat protein